MDKRQNNPKQNDTSEASRQNYDTNSLRKNSITSSSSKEKYNLPADDSLIPSQPPAKQKKSSILKINSGLNLIRKSSSSLFSLKTQHPQRHQQDAGEGSSEIEHQRASSKKKKEKSQPRTAWSDKPSKLFMVSLQQQRKSSSRLLSRASLTSSTTSTTSVVKSPKTSYRESNILSKEQKRRVEKLLKKFNKKKQQTSSDKGESTIINTSDMEFLHSSRGSRAANISSIHEEEYFRPSNVKQRMKHRKHVEMITSTLEDYGDGSTLTDLIDYSKMACEDAMAEHHCTLLVLHALKEAVKKSQIIPYKDMFVREECYEEFLEEERKRNEELKMTNKKTTSKKNSISKIAFKKNNHKRAMKSVTAARKRNAN